MLGRYVAGTLLILGVAMIVAPEAPKDESPAPEVARAAAAPSALVVDQAATNRASEVISKRAEGTQSEFEQAPRDGIVRASLPTEAEQEDLAPELSAAIDEVNALAAGLNEAESRPVPTFENPETISTDVITQETLALITSSEEASTELPEEEIDALASSNLMYVTGSRVNVRSGPSTRYGVIGSVTLGEAVELVTLEGSSWARIRLSDGQTGFMASRFLSRESAGG